MKACSFLQQERQWGWGQAILLAASEGWQWGLLTLLAGSGCCSPLAAPLTHGVQPGPGSSPLTGSCPLAVPHSPSACTPYG